MRSSSPFCAENMFASLPTDTGPMRPSMYPWLISWNMFLSVKSSNTEWLVLYFSLPDVPILGIGIWLANVFINEIAQNRKLFK